jgi:hypothetical protein
VSRTIITSGLLPSTQYYVRVVAYAPNEVLAETDALPATTPAAATSFLDVFADERTPGTWLLPAEFGVDTTAPFSGAASLGYPSAGGGQVLHYGGLGLDITALDATTFPGAYLELAIDCAGGDMEYGEVALYGATRNIWFSWPDYYVCGPGYRVVQVPLSRFRDDTGEYATATSIDSPLDQLWMYGAWEVGAVRIDAVRIGY